MTWNSELCHLCLGRRHDTSGCDLLSAVTRQRRQLTGICGYPHCKSTGDHSTYFCRHLNGRCTTCLFRGHLPSDGVCDAVIPNFELFQEWFSHGYLTQNCEDIRAASCGFFPVLTVTENKFLEALGGYSYLLSMAPGEAVEFCHSLSANEKRLVGAEPFLTELCVQSALSFFSRRRSQATTSTRNTGRNSRRSRGRGRSSPLHLS